MMVELGLKILGGYVGFEELLVWDILIFWLTFDFGDVLRRLFHTKFLCFGFEVVS